MKLFNNQNQIEPIDTLHINQHFDKLKSTYNNNITILVDSQKIKFKFNLVFNELDDFKHCYLLFFPKFKILELLFRDGKPFYIDHFEQSIKPSFIKQFNHYVKFKYVLNRILCENLQNQKILYNDPILPIIDKPIIEHLKQTHQARFPCNFEKVYNEPDFNTYLLIHHHKFKNQDTIDLLNNQIKKM